MVYYFETSDGHLIYMGKDKFENEDLIKYGWDEDIWFHVDDLSSAHVYLRMKEGETWTDLPPRCVQECSQLVKANSIQGCKKASVNIVYTPWSNLHKTVDMEVGAIGFHSEKNKKYVKNVSKDKDIIKQLIKTQSEETNPDFAAKKEAHKQEIKKAEVKKFKEEQQIKRQQEKEQKLLEQQRSYDLMLNPDLMKSNKDTPSDEEDDDFM